MNHPISPLCGQMKRAWRIFLVVALLTTLAEFVLAPTYTDGSTYWQYYLPRSGDNTITVYGSGSNWMTVEIPPA